jgi:membrane protease YdiL (CAAX protease family)
MEKSLSTLEVSMTTAEKKSFLVRHPLLSYYLMSCSFFWTLLILFGAIVVGALHVDPTAQPWTVWIVTILGSWMPSLSAAIVVRATQDPEAVAGLFARLVRFKLPVRWYLASLIPLGVVALAVLGYRLAGGAPEGSVPLTFTVWFNMLVINLLTGPTGEEPGWRGFALPRLLERYSPIKAGLVLGLMWSFWHLGLWLVASGYSGTTLLVYILEFTVTIVALNLLMVWIYQHVPDSLAPMMVAHYTFNFAASLIFPGALGLGARLPLFGWLAGAFVLIVVIIWVLQSRRPADPAAVKASKQQERARQMSINF